MERHIILPRSNHPGVSIIREMTITHDDFFRLLPNALAGYPFTAKGHSVRVKIESGSVAIQLMPESIRMIGALALPVTRLNFYFENSTQDEIQLFFDNFDPAYQKAGG